MLGEFRSTHIIWDKATSRIYPTITANESDENGRKLVVQVVNSGQVEDLTRATLHLYWETRDKAHDGLDVFKAVDLKKGEFELSYTTGMLSNKGVLNANLVLVDSVGRVVSERFKITVTDGINDDAIQSENSFTTLTQALIDISDLEQNYAPRLNDLTAQLQQTEQEFNAQLAQIATQPLNYNGRGTGQHITIEQAFPNVTLTDVQALDVNATLSNMADWYVLQKLIHDADSNNDTRLNFPQGNFILDRPINFTEKLGMGWIVEASGCVVTAAENYTGKMVILSRGSNYGKTRNGRIKGLGIEGNHTASIGIDINNALEWFLDNVRIYRCFVGVQLTDVYYGEISGESVIQSCLVGIKTMQGVTNEVNTVNFDNIKINFATLKTRFIPKNEDESDDDYNNRVESVGIELNTSIYGCKFNGLTIEAMDYGFYGTKVQVEVGTNTSSFFGIHQCYFESIKKSSIHLISYAGYTTHYFTVTIEQCRFYSASNIISKLGEGTWRILGNQPTPVEFVTIRLGTVQVETDLPTSFIKSDPTKAAISIKQKGIATRPNVNKYNDFGDSSTSAKGHTMFPTIQDGLYLEHRPILRSSKTGRTKNHEVFSLNTKPLTFTGKKASVVLQGDDNKYYMILVKGGSLVLKEVKNLNRIDYPISGIESKELYQRTSSAGEKFFNVDTQQDVEFKDGKWKQRVGTPNEIIAIGTTSEIANTTPPNPDMWGQPSIWNVQTDSGYNWYGKYWAFSDWFGNNTNKRAIGTIAQRPTDPAIDNFIYFATDESKYYKWDTSSNSYSDFTPLF